MHNIQEKILELSKSKDVLELGYRPLGRLIDVDKPQLVKHHVQQLLKNGLLRPKSRKDIQYLLSTSSNKQPTFVEIPMLGAANCGPASIVAEEQLEKSIRVSESILKKLGNIFALLAVGDSMNQAKVNHESIEDGDYVIIDSDQKSPAVGDYILSIIDNCANIKKYMRTKDGGIALLSESTEKYPPIYIHEDDDFIVNGKVIQVIKGVK
ncbi:hypothetical protein COU74_00020 [Candidatus Peregrinibacteria bacterium CG10_big_fil_rev_8_21_14_0_10_36_19]|nr:MAG: hypothetical protein COU74_00020 [Candidatus Peregrinibacteria bacterium CG10_big_fil_rev_8_21_14_0_10_36_19]